MSRLKSFVEGREVDEAPTLRETAVTVDAHNLHQRKPYLASQLRNLHQAKTLQEEQGPLQQVCYVLQKSKARIQVCFSRISLTRKTLFKRTMMTFTQHSKQHSSQRTTTACQCHSLCATWPVTQTSPQLSMKAAHELHSSCNMKKMNPTSN